MKKKICFITYSMFSLGGAQRVISVLSNELKNIYDVEILCTDDNFKENRQMYNIDKDIKINICKEISKKSILRKFPQKIFKKVYENTKMFDDIKYEKFIKNIYYPNNIRDNLIKYINTKQYDVVIGAEGYFSMLLSLIRDKINSKVIGWEHSSYEAYLKTPNQYYWKQDKLFKKYLPNLDKHIVLTNIDKISFEKELDVKSDVIYNPLSFRVNNKSSCDNKQILFVGRLVKQKGLEYLIEAFEFVSKKYPDWLLLIVGDGDEKNKLYKKIKLKNLQEKILMIGKSEDVKKYYLESSILVSSSMVEGFGMSIIEAMECGLPVVAFENSGPKEIINVNYKNGILVERNDATKLANAILYLIENIDERKKISKNAYIRAEYFSKENIVIKWKDIISELTH